MDKRDLIDQIRILKIETIQNDNFIQSYMLGQTNKKLIRIAKHKWRKEKRRIIKQAKRLEREMILC